MIEYSAVDCLFAGSGWIENVTPRAADSKRMGVNSRLELSLLEVFRAPPKQPLFTAVVKLACYLSTAGFASVLLHFGQVAL